MIPEAQLRTLYATMTLREIANATDYNWSYVARMCRKYGIPLRLPGQRVPRPQPVTLEDTEREVVLLALHLLSTTGGYDRKAWASAYAKMGGK